MFEPSYFLEPGGLSLAGSSLDVFRAVASGTKYTRAALESVDAKQICEQTVCLSLSHDFSLSCSPSSRSISIIALFFSLSYALSLSLSCLLVVVVSCFCFCSSMCASATPLSSFSFTTISHRITHIYPHKNTYMLMLILFEIDCSRQSIAATNSRKPRRVSLWLVTSLP